jgi:GntR family transcriptional regulator
MATDPENGLDRLQLHYQRVQKALAEEIGRGSIPPGSRLPPERALAEHFGVSRVTLRRALAELETTGVVSRLAGQGWSVARSPIGEPPNELMSFSEMAASRGLRPSARVIGKRVRPASLDEADALGVAPGAALFELERLRLMDDVPILIDRSRIPLAMAPTLQEVDFSSASLYAVLEERHGLRPARARFAVDAIAANEDQARLLDLWTGEPLLHCHQLTEDDTGQPIESCDMVYRGDRYRFRATLVRARVTGPESPNDRGPRSG